MHHKAAKFSKSVTQEVMIKHYATVKSRPTREAFWRACAACEDEDGGAEGLDLLLEEPTKPEPDTAKLRQKVEDMYADIVMKFKMQAQRDLKSAEDKKKKDEELKKKVDET